jgi:hypothetical protein
MEVAFLGCDAVVYDAVTYYTREASVAIVRIFKR